MEKPHKVPPPHYMPLPNKTRPVAWYVEMIVVTLALCLEAARLQKAQIWDLITSFQMSRRGAIQKEGV